MDYTIKNGEFYKVMFEGKILTLGKLENDNVLSTIHEVIFISEDEYNTLNKDR